MPKTGEYIFKKLRKNSNTKVWFIDNLEEAVRLAKKVTQKDMICVLSPAASSYGYFKNFQERGNLFKKFVLENNDLT